MWVGRVRHVGHLIFKRKMPKSFAHERCLDHLMRNFSAKLLADGEAKPWAKLSKQISRNHCPTRRTRLTRPTSPFAKREAERPLGGAASPLPAIRRHTGNEDVVPPVWLNPARSSLGGGTPPLNQAELRDGRRRCCTGRPEIGTAFRRIRPLIAVGDHEPTRR